MNDEVINCGRCANLWGRNPNRPGFGICGSHARMETTGEVNPTVSLDYTCEYAKLSAKLDPNFMKRIYEERAGKWDYKPIE